MSIGQATPTMLHRFAHKVKHAIDLFVYFFGRDALTPGRSKEFNDKIGNGSRVVGAHVWQMVCHPSVQKFQSARAHAGEKPAAILGFLARAASQ